MTSLSRNSNKNSLHFIFILVVECIFGFQRLVAGQHSSILIRIHCTANDENNKGFASRQNGWTHCHHSWAILPPFRFCGCEHPIAQTPASAALGACYTVQVISKARLSRDYLLNKGGSVVIKVDWYGPCTRPILYVVIVILVYAINPWQPCSYISSFDPLQFVVDALCQFSTSGKISIVRQKYHMCERTLRFHSYYHWNNLYPLNVRSSRPAVLKTRIWLYKSKQLHFNSINYENQSFFISNQFL